jgi:hypothetical protein
VLVKSCESPRSDCSEPSLRESSDATIRVPVVGDAICRKGVDKGVIDVVVLKDPEAMLDGGLRVLDSGP